MTRLVSVACAIVVGWMVAGCKDSQACEEGRLQLAKTWRKVKDTAAARALPAADEELNEAQKAERKRVWSEIQERAYVVEGSFKTTHITWGTAEKGRAELQVAYQNVPDKEDPLVIGFARMLAEANGEFETYKEKCK
jgi:hypothetical protein